MINYLVLLRHGHCAGHIKDCFTSFSDVDLTDQGRAESRMAGEQLKSSGITFDQTFSSTLTRVQDSAKITLTAAGQAHLIDGMICSDSLRGRNGGDVIGMPKADARKKYGVEEVNNWRTSIYGAPPNGDSLHDLFKRHVQPYYQKTIQPHLAQGSNVLITTHGNTIRALFATMGLIQTEQMYGITALPGSPIIFEMKNDQVMEKCRL
jgi:2,3-bisphosphoglycerate-dependent phosphoglycerate mutase